MMGVKQSKQRVKEEAIIKFNTPELHCVAVVALHNI